MARACSNRTRRNGFKLKESSIRLYIRKKSFAVRRVEKGLPRETMDGPSLEVFKAWLDGGLNNLV